MTKDFASDNSLHDLPAAAMLQVIRRITRTAAQGSPPDKLLGSACRALVDTGHFTAAWATLLSDNGAPPQSFQHGGERTSDALTAIIRIETKSYGSISAAVSQNSAPSSVHAAFLRELADDLAFALRTEELNRENTAVAEALRREALRRRVLECASRDGIAVFNQEHEIVEANPRFAEMLGYSMEELLTLHTWDFEALMPEAEIRKAFQDLAHTSATFETKHRRKDGSTYDAEVSASGTMVGDEALVLTISRDITEKKNLQSVVAQSERLAGMGVLAAGIAHEINNPLAYVFYNLESMLEDIPALADPSGEGGSPPTIEDLTDRCREALTGIRRIQSITRTLGTFSRVEINETGPVDIHHAVESAANMAFNEIKYRGRLTKCYTDVPTLYANEGRLSQIFLNLLINAAHALDEAKAAVNEVRVRTWAEDGSVCVEVCDTGRGISPENLPLVFEPFFTTKGSGVGTGLGLSISQSIAAEYGGHITAKSELGKGSCFTVCLPVQESIVETPVAPTAHKPLTARKGRILLVDDEASVCRAVQRILRHHEMVAVGSAAEAQALLKTDSRFDLVICDMMMPIMSGMDFHAWLAESHPILAERFVFITGGAFTPKSHEYLREAEIACIEKPFDTAALKTRVDELIAHHAR